MCKGLYLSSDKLASPHRYQEMLYKVKEASVKLTTKPIERRVVYQNREHFTLP